MKQILYFTLLLIFSSTTLLNAQVPISLEYDGNDVTNSEILLEKGGDGMYIHVTNNGTSDMDITVEVTDVNIPSEEDEYVMEVCWGLCIHVTVPIVIGTVYGIKAGETNTEFHISYNPEGTGPADILFHIYEAGNSSDFITLSLDTEYGVGVNDLNEKEIISIYPNPATDYLNINVSEEFINTEIIITNVIGKVIKSIEIQNQDNRLSVNELSKGIYFVSLIKDKKVLTTKKLIIN